MCTQRRKTARGPQWDAHAALLARASLLTAAFDTSGRLQRKSGISPWRLRDSMSAASAAVLWHARGEQAVDLDPAARAHLFGVLEDAPLQGIVLGAPTVAWQQGCGQGGAVAIQHMPRVSDALAHERSASGARQTEVPGRDLCEFRVAQARQPCLGNRRISLLNTHLARFSRHGSNFVYDCTCARFINDRTRLLCLIFFPPNPHADHFGSSHFGSRP